MKSMWRLLVLVGALGACMEAKAQQAPKIATIDLKRVFSEHSKFKESEAKVTAAREQAQSEFNERVTFLKGVEKQVTELTAEVAAPGLDQKEVEEKRRRLEMKAREVENLKIDIQDFLQTRQQQIADMGNRLRADLLAEIFKGIAGRLEEYDLVFDSSGHSVDEVKTVIFSKESIDLTSAVIADFAKSASAKKP